MQAQILQLNKAGQVLEWIGIESVAYLYAKNQVVWTFGESPVRLHGDQSRSSGLRSILDIAPVITISGQVHEKDTRALSLYNASLFRGDGNIFYIVVCLFVAQSSLEIM